MFPSGNNDNPLESLFQRSSFLCEQNPNNSKQDDPPPFFNFPSPFFDENELPLNQILYQNHLMAGKNHHAPDPSEKRSLGMIDQPLGPAMDHGQIRGGGAVAPLRRRNLGAIPRRRTGKKDRHSKICTAQGIRDRRMRLSLQVARKFFDLQDMLGYDKASKTIEWLFTKSKKAIKELAKDHPQANNNSISETKSESFISECEVVSGIEENSNNELKESVAPENTTQFYEKNEKKSQNPICKPSMRESRDKARARARCRTREKMMIKWYKSSNLDANDLQKLGLSQNNPFEGVDRESNSEMVSSFSTGFHTLQQQLAHDVGTAEKLLGISSSSTSCPIPDYHCSGAVSGYIDPNSTFMGFLGNWDLLDNDRMNSIQYAITNQVSLTGNPNSVFSATPSFP